MSHVFHSNFERISVIELQVCVNREAEVFLNLLTQLVQQVLFKARNKFRNNNIISGLCASFLILVVFFCCCFFTSLNTSMISLS